MENRIENLIDQLTLEEKVSMLSGKDMWHTVPVDRLGIPAIKMCDGPHGTRVIPGSNSASSLPATGFPTGAWMGATWNPDLIEKIGQVLGDETKAKGCHILLGPCINIHRSPLGGRNFESFSEDPFHMARLSVAYIKGVQSKNIGTSVKHYALNNSEFERFTMSSEVDERTIREIYLPAFEASVKEAQPYTIMNSYNKINGTYASENTHLLTDILKGEWGFEGLVVSDWFAFGSTEGSALGGLDLEMPGPARLYGHWLVTAVNEGKVSEDIINDKIRRILKIIEKVGAFDGPQNMDETLSDSPGHRAVARQAADEAMVLLKNENSVLPLDKNKLKTLAVIGPNAAVSRFQGGGSSRVNPYYTSTPLDALKESLNDSVEIIFEKGCNNDRLVPLFDHNNFSPVGDTETTGLWGEYFENEDMTGEPVISRVEKNFSFGWVGTTDSAIKTDMFSTRWTGSFNVPKSGVYKFSMLSNGLCRLTVNGKLLVEKWKDDMTSPPTPPFVEIKLEEGACPVVAEYRPMKGPKPPFMGLRLGCEIPMEEDAMDKAARAAGNADAALVFVGLTAEIDAEGADRPDYAMSEDQEELIRKIAQANPNTVVVLTHGSPVSLESWIDNVPAVLAAGYLGQESGNAIAAALLGDVNPSGKLPETYPKRMEDTPAFINYPGENGKLLYGEGLFVGYRYYDAKQIEPRYPFGHGLSYTSFEYGPISFDSETIKKDGEISASIDITNTGPVAGKEVVQVYIRDIESTLRRPVKELKCFEKVSLDPGQTKTLTFKLGDRSLSFYNPAIKSWVVEEGEFEVIIGSSSRDLRSTALFTVEG